MRALSIKDAPGYFYLGVARHRLGRLQDAAAALRQAVSFPEASSEVPCALATVLSALGKRDEAVAELLRAIQANPTNAQSHHNVGVLLAQSGERQRALEHYDRALECDARHSGARVNRASLRLATGDAKGALEDYDELCASPGIEADSRAGRVRALLLLHRDEEALQAAEDLLRSHPNDQFGWRLKAIAAASLYRLAEAEAASARSREPASGSTLFIGRALDRQDVCDWRDRNRLLEHIRAAIVDGAEPGLWSASLLFHALAMPFSGSEIRIISERVAARARLLAPPDALEPLPPPSVSGRIRVGFISPDFRDHPTSYLLRRLFLERNRERFEYYAYALNSGDGSAIRLELEAAVDSFVDVSSWGTIQIANRIRRDRLDLLIDASGYLEGTRPELLAVRVAPIQASYLGTPCSMGPGFVDYRITDPFATPPDSQADWGERLLQLDPPIYTFDNSVHPSGSGSRSEHGLPERGFVFCAFHQPFKLDPEFFYIWLRLLIAVPDSVLWLLDGGPLVRDNLVREAARYGVTGSRIIFATRLPLRTHHLGRLRHADLFLDAFFYNAHTTALDALWAGVPVLTRPGGTMASRLAATFVRGAGLDELIVPSSDAYESKALELARNPETLAKIKESLANARSSAPTFDTVARVRAVERAFIAMVERQRAGQSPNGLVVG